MSHEIEKMLLSNNTESHGVLKTAYQQWYQTQIYEYIVCFIILVIGVIVSITWYKKSVKQFEQFKASKDNPNPIYWEDESVFTWLNNKHTLQLILLVAVMVLSAGLLMMFICRFPQFLTQPYVEFVRYIVAQ